MPGAAGVVAAVGWGKNAWSGYKAIGLASVIAKWEDKVGDIEKDFKRTGPNGWCMMSWALGKADIVKETVFPPIALNVGDPNMVNGTNWGSGGGWQSVPGKVVLPTPDPILPPLPVYGSGFGSEMYSGVNYRAP